MRKSFHFLAFLVVVSLCSCGPPTAEELYWQSKVAYDKGDAHTALVLVDSAIGLDSADVRFFELRGKLHVALHDSIAVAYDFAHSIELTGDSGAWEEYRKLIDWDVINGDKAQAKQFILEFLKRFEDDSLHHEEALVYAGNKLARLGEDDLAIELFDQILREYPSKIHYEYRLGVLYEHHEDNRKMLKHYKAYLNKEGNKHRAEVCNSLGVYYMEHKNKWQAKKYFKEGMELGNENCCNNYRELSAVTRYNTYSRCCDGSTSSATGRGACSHHGGVCKIVHEPL